MGNRVDADKDIHDLKLRADRQEAATRFMVGEGRRYFCGGVLSDQGRDIVNGILDGTLDLNGALLPVQG